MASGEPTRGDDDPGTRSVNLGDSSLTPQSPSFFEFDSRNESFELTGTAFDFEAENLPLKFGNYVLQEILGEGGAGVVFKAIPNSHNAASNDFDVVALKIIRPDIMASPKAAQRFEKESRVHAVIDSKYVTRHLEYGCERGVHFIASEYVEGVSLSKIMALFQRSSARHTFRIVADILKALVALHDKGVIHRDVKPANVITNFRSSPDLSEPLLDDFVIAKLTDFGLARHIEQSESLAMTRQQTLLGTPLYMAPEQYFESRSVDARADLYSVGVTLYQMLAGRPPFQSEEMADLAEMHRTEHARPLTLAREGTSEAINNIVMKALEKDPDLRYQNASEMLADVECVLNDQPTSLRLFPETPDTYHPSVRSYDFEWNLDATAKQLWPLVSDTDRFNQAIGLPAPNFTYDHSQRSPKIFAEANFNGMKVRWREHPFQWILERQMSVLREFESGPFEWVTSTVELQPLASNKTRLVHSFQVKPRGLFGKLMTPLQFNLMTRRSLRRVYSKLESIAKDKSCSYACDVSFSNPVRLSNAQKKALEQRIEKLATSISNRPLVKEFSNLIGTVADPFAARIRPIPLSQRLECSRETSLELCLKSVEAGILNLSWDLICPVCRIAAGNTDSLSRLKDHAHCKVCNLDLEIDFSNTVEVIFSVHPEIRPIKLKTYCIGGPFHAPHVLAQNRLLVNQFVDVGLTLVPGNYHVCGPQLAELRGIRVHEKAVASRAEVSIGDSSTSLPDLQTGAACIHIENQSESEVLVRFEQSTDRGDSISAASASQHPLFQKLFPNEIIEPEELVDVSNVYLLGIKLLDADKLFDQIGEIKVRQQMGKLQQQFHPDSANCEILECTHDSILVSFNKLKDVVDSVNRLLSQHSLGEMPIDACCFAIDSGEIMVGMQANQPTAFGKTVRKVKRMLTHVSDFSIVMPLAVFDAVSANDYAFTSQILGEFRSVATGENSELIKLIPKK